MKKIICILMALLLISVLLTAGAVTVMAAMPDEAGPTDAVITAMPEEDTPDVTGGIELPGIVPVVSITAVCLLAGYFVSCSKLDNKYIPLIVGAVGCALGILSFYVTHTFDAPDAITAAGIGVISGLAATGINQLCRQLKSKGGGNG